jgi:lysophospholipase L1-like esterase
MSSAEYHEFQPRDGRAAIINCLRTFDGDDAVAEQPVCPDGRSELVVHCAEPFQEYFPNSAVTVRSSMPSTVAAKSRITRNILAGLAFSLLTACSGGSAPVQPTPAAPAQAAPISNVVAFMGDSITQLWDIPQYDTTQPTINFGIDGQTTPAMLNRFDNEVIASAPGVVVILGGINDIVQYDEGDITTPPSIESITAMAAMAQSAGIKVILCSVLPTNIAPIPTLPLVAGIPATVDSFNQQLIALAAANGYLYADYYDEMLAPDGTQNTALFMDQVHPNAAGYAVMWEVLAPLLQEDGQ